MAAFAGALLGFLKNNISRRTSLLLYFFEILLIGLAIILSNATGVSIAIVVMVGLFHVITEILKINQGMEQWLLVIKKMEHE